jgi:hypothetical protein
VKLNDLLEWQRNPKMVKRKSKSNRKMTKMHRLQAVIMFGKVRLKWEP